MPCILALVICERPHCGRVSGALWGLGFAGRRCRASVPAGLGALALLVIARSRFPAADCWPGL